MFAVPFFLLLLIIEWTAARKLAPHREPSATASGAYLIAATHGPASRWAWCRSATSAVMERSSRSWLCRDLRLCRAVAPARQRMVHVGDRHRRRGPACSTSYHRIAHRVRLIWATHQAHHSSEYFNFATALRQKWNNSGDDPAVDSVAAVGRSAVDGVRQLLDQPDLPVLDPHRTHRQAVAANRVRLQHALAPPGAPRHGPRVPRQELRAASSSSGTACSARFQPEKFRPHYGLTKPVDTFNIWKLQTREYVAMARDVRAARRWRDKLGYIFGPPGWEPRRRVQPDIAAPIAVPR